MQTLTKNWWLLALTGVLDAIISGIHLFMGSTHGPVSVYAWNGTIVVLGELALAGGACAIAAGIWRSAKGQSWLLVLNGLALGGLGLIYYKLNHFQISFRTVALLFLFMAFSIGILTSIIARTLRRQGNVADGWLLGFAGVAAIGFALAFFAFAIHWISLSPASHADLFWFGSFLGFSAICKLWLALRLHQLGPSQSAQWNAPTPLANPSHAH